MLWLALHMWALLFAAFIIGLVVGWWVWGQRPNTPAPAPRGNAPLGSLDLDDEASSSKNTSNTG